MRILVTWVDSGWGAAAAPRSDGALERLLTQRATRWDALYVLAPRALRAAASAALAQASERADAANLWPAEVPLDADAAALEAACSRVVRALPEDARVEVVAQAGPRGARAAWQSVARGAARVTLLEDAAARPAPAPKPGPRKPLSAEAFEPLATRVARVERAAIAEALALSDQVVVLDIYAAREDPEPGVTGALVSDSFADQSKVHYVPNWDDAPAVAAKLAGTGDFIITMGCGDVYRMVPQLIEALEA